MATLYMDRGVTTWNQLSRFALAFSDVMVSREALVYVVVPTIPCDPVNVGEALLVSTKLLWRATSSIHRARLLPHHPAVLQERMLQELQTQASGHLLSSPWADYG